jgi:hypothetical protein
LFEAQDKTESVSAIHLVCLICLRRKSAALPVMEAHPNLPSDLQREVLLRVPYSLHDKMKAVCRSWKDMMSSPQFYEDRKTCGTSEHFICLIHSNLHRESENGVILTNGITVYDPRNGTRKRVPPSPYFPRLPQMSEFLSVNRKLVLLGAGGNPMNMVFIYDFQCSKWRRGADMPTTRYLFACSVSSSKGLIYVAGGRDERGNILATAEVYDVEEDKWEILPPMAQKREGSRGVFFEGKFMVISGGTRDLQRRVDKSAEAFDAKTGTWNRLEDMWSSETSVKRCWIFVSACGNLYGIDGLLDIFKYDAQKNVWTSLAFLPTRTPIITCAAPWRDRIFVSVIDSEGRDQVPYLFQPSTGQSIVMDGEEEFADHLNLFAATLEI